MSWANTSTPVRTVPRWLGAATWGRAIGQSALSVLLLVIGFTVVTVLAYLTAGPTGSVGTFVVVQTVLGLLVVMFLVRWRVAAGLRSGLPALPWAALSGFIAYVVVPGSWTGSALFWWQLVDRGPLAFFLDLPVWMAAVALGVLWGASQQELVRGPATPYG